MRIGSLDGLRGLAALIVLVHHTLECIGASVNPALQATFLTLGQQAVWIFFILSGVVLTLQANAPGFQAERYVPARLARLYVPTIAAVVLAYISILAVPRHNPTGNPWVDMHAPAVSLNAVVSDFTLINGTSNNFLPLWSLKWEVLYSLLLLGLVYFARKMPFWAIAPVVLAGSAGLGDITFYGSMFVIGTMLGLHWHQVSNSKFATSLYSSIAFLLGVAMISVSNALQTVVTTPELVKVSIALSLTGIPLLVLGVAHSPMRKLFGSKPMRWLGLISFSLYLVHEPVLMMFVRLGHLSAWVVLLGSAGSIIAAWLFYLLIEKRAHLLSRAILNGRERHAL